MRYAKRMMVLLLTGVCIFPATVQASSADVFADVGKIAAAEQILSKMHLPGIGKPVRHDKAARKQRKEEKKKQAQLLKAYHKYDFQSVQQWAAANDPEAMFIMAYAYKTGQELPRDKEKAVEWYEKAADVNEELADIYQSSAYTKKTLPLPRLYALAGRRAHLGLAVPQSYDSAVRWSQLGAREGDSAAMAYIGSAYYTGRGLPRDDKQAIEYFRKTPHEPLSVSLLADAYKKGRGVQKNPQKGEEYATFLRMAKDKMTDKYGKGVL